MPISQHVRLARFVAAAELPIILAIAPALLFPTPTRLLVLLVVPVLWLCARAATGRLVPLTPMNAVLWVMLAMVGVSLHTTFDILFSLDKVSGVVLGVLLFWAISRWLTTARRLQRSIAAFLLAGAVLAVVGLLGTPPQTESKFRLLGAVAGRIPIIGARHPHNLVILGVPGALYGFNPNPLAASLALFVPLQIALLATSAHRWLFPRLTTRWAGTWLVVIQAVFLFLTAGTVLLMQSRGAWVGLIISAVAVAAWHSRRTLMVAVGAAGVVVVLVIALAPRHLFDVATSGLPKPDLASTISVRVELWSKALSCIQDYPVTGMGMNVFRKKMPILHPVSFVRRDVDIVHAHNNLLQAALDLGILGLIAYLSIWIVAGALLVLVYRRSRERAHRVTAVGLGAGLIAYFIFGMTDAIPLGSKVGVLFWLTLALTVGLHRVALPVREAIATRR